MKFAATFLTTLGLIGAISAEDAVVDIWTGSGCSGTKQEIELDRCTSVTGASAQQNLGKNGIKWTCNGFSDSNCKTKVGEVYDCLNGAIAAVNCYENPPL